MKAVILCGGKGTRMREETEFRPKPLVLVGGMPILWHIMKIYSQYGIKEFVLCLGYKGDMIKDYFLNFEQMTKDFTLDLRSKEARVLHHDANGLEDWRITFVNTGEDAETGNRIARIEPFVQGETFCLTYGDGLADIDLGKLIAFHQAKGKTLTCTGVHPEVVYGILGIEDGVAKTFREKPKSESIINGGFFVCGPKVFDYLDRDKTCIFEREPMQRIVADQQLSVYHHDGFWYCMDTYKHVEDLNKRWKQGDAPWKIWS